LEAGRIARLRLTLRGPSSVLALREICDATRPEGQALIVL